MTRLYSARQEFVAFLETEFPAIYPGNVLHYQNGPMVDPANEGDLSILTLFQYNSAQLGNIGYSGNMGYGWHGNIILDISVPEGSGMNKTLQVADSLIDLLKARQFNTFYISAPRLLDPYNARGRCVTPFLIPVIGNIA